MNSNHTNVFHLFMKQEGMFLKQYLLDWAFGFHGIV